MSPRVMNPKRRRVRRPVKKSADDSTADESTTNEVAVDASASSTPKVDRAPAKVAWSLSGTSAVLLWASFTPLDWGPLAWVAVVPLILLVRATEPTRRMYTAITLTGFAFTLATLQWMRLGHVTMYLAWFALAAYLAIYFPVFVGVTRVAVHRLSVPLVIAVPTVWVGLEYVRAHLITGFSWYYLGHTQYRWIELIQVSDLVGAYGVSFIVATMAACLAAVLPTSLLVRLRLLSPVDDATNRGGDIVKRPVVALLTGLILFAAVLGYGYFRRSEANFQQGPRVALIQGDFTSEVKHDKNAYRQMFDRHYQLTGLAVRHQPDLIVWPETMYRTPLFVASPHLTDQQLQQAIPGVPVEAWNSPETPQALTEMGQQAGASLIIGIDTLEAQPKGYRQFNSAAFVRPEMGLVNRYDKVHRVLFGEYIPLRDSLPWLHQLTPFPADFGIDAGEAVALFDTEDFRFAPIICFEDTVPHLVRNIVDAAGKPEQGNKPIDCLVNLTNDGWFHGSSELDQHLITALFRAVECRTPMVRAVNTGISAFIDGDGVVVEPDVFIDGDDKGRNSIRDPETGRWHKQLNAALVHNVPLDDRSSLYVRGGDWFAGTCCFFVVFVAMFGLVPSRKSDNSDSDAVISTSSLS